MKKISETDDIYHMRKSIIGNLNASAIKVNPTRGVENERISYDDINDDTELIIPVDGRKYFGKRIIKIKVMTKETYDEKYINNLNQRGINSEEITPKGINPDVFSEGVSPKGINSVTFSEVSESQTWSEKFPNALLIENTIFDKKESLFENTSSPIPTTEENIWDILKKIKPENNKINITKGKKICKNCGEKDSFTEDPYASIIVCLKCGMVNEEIIDNNPEWRQYNNDDSRGEVINRCGGPSNYFLPHSSQGTIIAGYSNNRLNRKQKWLSTDYRERNLTKEFEFITQICLANGIKKHIIDTTKIMYTKISRCKHKTGKNIGEPMITRGDKRISIMAVCVSKSCETNRKPVNNSDIAKMFGISETRLTKGFGIFENMRENCDDAYIFDQLHSSTSEDFIRCYCESLNISKKYVDLAVQIATNCNKMKLATNHNSRSLAAGVILTMVEFSDLDVERKEIAKQSKTSPTTINKIYGEIMPYIDALIDDDITNHVVEHFGINGSLKKNDQ